jgi:oligopeptide/dipeptide ABC transporter ATP-binding protein
MLLEVRGLKKYFGGRRFPPKPPLRAVDGVDLDIARSQTLALVGESGCGKSTLGRAILRLQEPTAGSVTLDGRSVTGISRRALRARRREMQIVFQDPFASLNPRRSVGQILEEPLRVHRVGDRKARQARVAELLDIVGLRAGMAARYPHEFSGGQRQRVGIARALALSPSFIVADEAVSALDVSVQAQILNLLADIRRDFGISFLFISHDLAVVRHIADAVAVMYLGRIVEQTDAATLFEGARHPYTRALLSAVPVPDPQTKRNRIVLPGDVPSATHPPAGCPFHPRCPEAFDRCRVETPPLVNAAAPGQPEHFVACHLHPAGGQQSHPWGGGSQISQMSAAS